MKLNEYQKLAKEFDQNPNRKILKSNIIPLFGIIGESGALISEFKKRFRDKHAHTKFNKNVEEILGNMLWYIANVSSKMDLTLEDIAKKNLTKIQDRFPSKGSITCITESFDEGYPANEQLPRMMNIVFKEEAKGGKKELTILLDGKRLGDSLTDNSYDDDGYRYHDVFHFSFAAILGWSPVIRKILNVKRKSNSTIDEVEDGARAAIIEEAISAFIYQHAKDHLYFENVEKVDHHILKTIRNIVSHLEVSKCNISEWERAILAGYKVFRKLKKNKGGSVQIDLDKRDISFIE